MTDIVTGPRPSPGTEYRLVPHPDFPSPDIAVSVEAARTAEGTFVIHYVVKGDVEHIRVPEPVRYASRQKNLWKHTCFEAFVAPSEFADYLEFNFAPSNAWDAFRFASYRVPGGDFPFPSPHLDVERSTGRLEMTVALDPTETSAMAVSSTWCLNFSAVIEAKDGTKSYWALAHAPGPPDFHNRACWIATLQAAGCP